MAVSVNIYVSDNELTPAPISGVVVAAFDPTTFTLMGQSTTDTNGQAVFLLPGDVAPGKSIEVRLFKLGVIFDNPMTIKVLEPVVPGTPNDFDIYATGMPGNLPVATDPRCCRCTGQFVDLTNTPIPNLAVRVMAQAESGTQIPKVVDSRMVAAEAMPFTTDANGRVSIDLVRGGSFWVTFAGEDEKVWPILVPNRSSANLIDLIHPQPVTLYYDGTVAPGNSVTVAVGSRVIVPFGLLFSDWEIIGQGLGGWATVMNSDPSIAGVGITNSPNPTAELPGALAIDGLTPGVVTITATATQDHVPSRVPAYSIAAPTLIVTVTP